MKRKITVLCLLALSVVLTAWGQHNPKTSAIAVPGSFMRDASEGVFTNALDKASNTIDFTTVDKTYIFGGWSNFGMLTNNENAAAPVFQLGAHGTAPFFWTLYTRINHTYGAIPDEIKNTSGRYNDYGTKTVTSGTTTTNHGIVNSFADTKFEFERTSIVNDTAGGIFSLGPVNLGLLVNYFNGNQGDPKENYTKNATFNYDTAAADAAPAIAADFTRNSVKSAKNLTTGFTLTAPVAFGDRYQLALTYGLRTSDFSSSESVIESAHKNLVAGMTFTETEKNDVVDKTTRNAFALDFATRLPPPVAGHAGNRLDLTAALSFALYAAEGSKNKATQVYSFDKVTKGLRSETAETMEFSNLTPVRVAVGAGHSFYFDLAEGFTFGMVPSVSALYSNDYQTYTPRTKWTQVKKTDLNGNGVLTDNGDVLETTTAVYDTPANVEYGRYAVTLSLPAAVQLKLGALPFSFVFGDTIQGTATLDATTVKTSGTTVTKETKTGTGTGTNDAVEVTSTGSNTSSYSTFTFVPANSTSFGLNVTFPAGITMDVMMNAQNLLNLESLKVQFVIPLN